MSSVTRRSFVTTTLAGAAALGDFGFLKWLTPLSANDVKLRPDRVGLSADIEPLVRLIEETDRGTLLEVIIQRIQRGTSYQELLTALMLAGVRGIKPRPVGFKFHAVLVVNSAHQASIAATDRERWLPLLWALDNYKSAQARNQTESAGWMMPPADEAKLPPGHQAKARFIAAMEDWDEEGADRAISAFVRAAGGNDVIETFWRFGARDFRDIGHKAIYVANAWRTLQTIGWRHAEPVMRSLAFALLDHEGDNPAKRDADADRPGRENLGRLSRFRKHWTTGKPSKEATADLLACLRTASPGDASEMVVQMLNKEIDPAALWDGVFLASGEALMRQPGIVGLHTVTTANALHFAYQNAADGQTRGLMLLQAAAFLPMFREAMKRRGQVRGDLNIDKLEKAEVKATGPAALEEIFAEVSSDRVLAARKTIALLEKDPSARDAVIAAGRKLVFNKGTDSHDYKFSSAILEDVHHASPAWRQRVLAAAMFYLKGTGDKDNDLIQRTRAALA
jgi:hypothetical protein